jgi:DNA-binding GntR family transcriptional regulator
MNQNSSARNTADIRVAIDYISLPQAVRDALRRRILNNELVAGQRLVESKLAEEFGVSRTTLRSALRELKAEGLIEISDRRGCFVARMSLSEIQDVCFARYLLEASVVEDDQIWITEEFLAEIEEVIETMDQAAKAGDAASIVDLDTQLHSLIINAGSRNRVRELWHTLDGQMGSLMRSSIDGQGIGLQVVADRHRDLVIALRTRKPDVIQKATKTHYLDSPSASNTSGESH